MMDSSVDLLEVWEGIDAKNDAKNVRSGFFFFLPRVDLTSSAPFHVGMDFSCPKVSI